MGVLDEIRSACAEVAAGADHVQIEEAGLARLADAIARDRPKPPALDGRFHHLGTPHSTLAFLLTLDTVNFGSGWFPFLRKRGGLSGYFTVALSLKERFDNDGPWSAPELAELSCADVARVLGQDAGQPEVAELMGLFARALNDLGEFLLEGYAGRFEGPLEEAAASAEKLVGILARMPFFDDTSVWRGRRVPLYKRAQLTPADLSLAFGGRGLGRFGDLDRLTIFADNLVPHVLRREGALVYSADLAARIDAEQLIAAGSEEEVEIRACAVHAVECLVDRLARRGSPTTARELDYVLWNRGQGPEYKARPRHRARSVYY